jgi:hypothetical protein
MIIEKHTQQSDLTKPKGKTEIVYTIKPEDQVEELPENPKNNPCSVLRSI